MLELVTIMVLVGILAVVALPRLDSSQAFRELAFHDDVVTALRYAQKSAVSKRRVVCAAIGPGSVVLTMAAANPAANCGLALAGADGRTPAAQSPSANVTLVAVPAGPLFFQPSGDVTSDLAGTIPANFTLTVTGQDAIAVVGATGHVQ
jgi:type II secretory pathway pseudopilin PulG